MTLAGENREVSPLDGCFHPIEKVYVCLGCYGGYRTFHKAWRFDNCRQSYGKVRTDGPLMAVSDCF